jgi:glycosyltransferase involved in cell wall biosynthesis
MTVCHLFSGDLWAGAEVVIFNLLGALQHDPGLRVLAVSLNEGVLTQRLRTAGITTHVIAESRHSLVGLARQIARLLRGRRVSILHAHRYKENALGWLVAKALGIPELITTVHGVSEASSDRGLERWVAPARRALDYALLKRAFSAVVAVSDDMKRVLVGRYGFRASQVAVIRNGGRFPARTPARVAPVGSFHIGTVSRLVPVKGLDLFLDIASAVRREIPAARFSILGDGPLRRDLVRRAAELRLGDGVVFLPPRPDPFEYYRSLDLYLNTSLHEGLPLSVVEAMAAGTPVISAAVGGIPEIVTHGEQGFLIHGREPGPFVERCLALLRDGALRAALGERAATTAHADLSAPSMAAAYGRLYAECAARAGAGGAVPAPTIPVTSVPEPRR